MIRVRDVVLVHFALNPDDEMSQEDVVAKTSSHVRTVNEALPTMVADGLLKRRRVGRVFLYSPGDELLRMTGATNRTPK